MNGNLLKGSAKGLPCKSFINHEKFLRKRVPISNFNLIDAFRLVVNNVNGIWLQGKLLPCTSHKISLSRFSCSLLS